MSPVWDVVGRARRGGVPARELAAALGIMLTDLAPLVTTRAPERVAVPPAAGARARFLGHACVLFEAPSGSTVLLDPLVAHRRPGCDDRFSFPDLPDRIDCVAITHAHLDHFDIDLPDRGCALVVVEGVRTLAAVEKKSWNRLAAGQSFYLSWEWLRPVEDIPGMETEYLIAYRDGSMVGALPTYVDRRRVMTRYQPDSVLDGSSCQ